MIIFSPGLVLSFLSTEDADNPSIGYHNRITISNFVARRLVGDTSAEDPLHPAAQMANPSTYLYFAQNVPGEAIYLQLTTILTPAEFNYFAFAGHNLGTGQRTLRLYGATTLDFSGNPVFTPISEMRILANDQPCMFVFEKTTYYALRLTIEGGLPGHVAACAVAYAGVLLVCERKVIPSFTPLNYGRDPTILGDMSEEGHFLGRLMLGNKLTSACNLSHLSKEWFRSHFDPFLEVAQLRPFFFAWAPLTYPNEVGYAWFEGQMPRPEIFDTSELWRITMNMQGIAA